MGRGRVVVVGGGVIGLACAHALLLRGCHVTLLDRAEFASGCSWGNGGWIVPSFATPIAAPGQIRRAVRSILASDGPLRIEPRALMRLLPWLWQLRAHCNYDDYRAGARALVKLNAHTMQRFDALAAQGVQFEEHRRGVLFLCLQQRELQSMHGKLAQIAEWGGSPCELLSQAAVREMEPAVADTVAGAIRIPSERHVRPDSLISGLLSSIRAAGADVRTNVNVSGWKISDGSIRAACTTDGEIVGDHFVVAAGVHSRALVRELMGDLPVHAGRGYSITYETNAPGVRNALDLVEAGIVCSPFNKGWRIAGYMDFSTADTNGPTPPSAARVESLRRAARRYLQASASAFDAGFEWSGQRPLAPDGLPIIGRMPQFPNGYVATGHGMLGVTLAPVTAELIADSIVDGRSGGEAAPFGPERFVA